MYMGLDPASAEVMASILADFLITESMAECTVAVGKPFDLKTWKI